MDIWTSEHGLRYVILDPMTTEEMSVTALRDRTASNGEPLWSGTNGVHLSAGSHRDLARAILALSEQMTSDDATDETGTVSLADSSSAKWP